MIVSSIVADDQDLFAQERKSFLYFGQSSYTPPRNYGFWGYSRSEQSDSVVPAAIIEESNASTQSGDSDFIPQTSPSRADSSKERSATSYKTSSNYKTSSKKSFSLPDSPFNEKSNKINNVTKDQTLFSKRTTARNSNERNSFEKETLPNATVSIDGNVQFKENVLSDDMSFPFEPNEDDLLIQSEQNVVLPPTGLKTDEELFTLLNQQQESTIAVEPNSLSDFMLTSVRAPRNSFFQRLDFDLSYIPNTKVERSGLTDLNLSATFAVPSPTVESPLLFKPIFSWTQIDLPKSVEKNLGQQLHLYSPGLETQYLLPITESILLNLDAKIQWSSDLKANDSRMLRITGYGAGIWKMGSQSRLILGALYTDVGNIKILPVAGIIWMPSEDFYINAYFPNPKIAKRLDGFQCLNYFSEKTATDYWLYFAGEFEGNQWVFQTKEKTINRNGSYGSTASLEYYDARCYAGLERRTADQIDWALEGGLVFIRHLDISSRDCDPGYSYEFEPKTTGFARLKIMY